MAITSLISNKHEWNNCFIKFLKLQNLKYEIRAKKAGKSERNRKKFDEDVMLCNTLWSDRRRLITKNISCLFAYFLTFHKKVFFFFFGFIPRKISFSGENIFSLATLSAIIY